MKMIAHLAPSLHFPARLSARFTQSLQETLTILIVTENRFATVTAVDDVVNSASILHAQLSGHDHSFSTSPQSVNVRLCGTDPFVPPLFMPPSKVRGAAHRAIPTCLIHP